jgi:hypothetical protein
LLKAAPQLASRRLARFPHGGEARSGQEEIQCLGRVEQVFEPGVGKKGAKDEIKGRVMPVETFTVSNASFTLS